MSKQKQRTVNLADRQASMELLKQLYQGAVKDDSQVQAKEAKPKGGCAPTSTRPVDEVHEDTPYPHSQRG